MRQAEGLASYHKTNYRYLPKNIAFDDFKTGKISPSGMSMWLMNSDTHLPIDIIQNRQGKSLEEYFLGYFHSARKAVETVTVDLFSPYRGIINRVFLNAIIIADRFHVINQVYRALDREIIKIMNDFGKNTPEYRQLKRFRKLLLKNMMIFTLLTKSVQTLNIDT